MNRLLQAWIVATSFMVFVEPALSDVSIEQLVEQAGLRTGPVASRDLERWQPPQKIVIRGGGEFVAELQAEFPGVQMVSADSHSVAAQQVTDADAIVGFCSDELVNAANRLVWIQLGGAGAERCLAIDAVANGEILLTNMQKMSSPVIGEHAIALMMSLTRGLTPYAKRMGEGAWDRALAGEARMISTDGRTALVVGLGGIGNEIARRASALGMRVIATRNSSRSGPDYVDYVGLSDELFELAGQADVIFNALPLTTETEGLFDREFFDAAKPGVFFVNVARGGSVVTDELVAALEDGRVAGAGLDVTDPEPLPPDHLLWQMSNVIITPHIAWYGSDNQRERALARENIRRFIAGDALLNVVDPARGY